MGLPRCFGNAMAKRLKQKHQPVKPRESRQGYEPRRNRDEKPRTKMTRTATQARAEAVMDAKRLQREQGSSVREEDERGGLGTFADYQNDQGEPFETDGEQAAEGQEVPVQESETIPEPELAQEPAEVEYDEDNPPAPPEPDLPEGPIPIVAIVGRPNVGKSSLFNKLAGSRISIEDPRPGTTRDRVSTLVGIREMGQQRVIELFDTAGIGIVDEKQVEAHVHEQIQYGIARADVILFVVDTKEGPTGLDHETAALLRRTGRPVLLVANKADAEHQDNLTPVFYELKVGEPHPVSAQQGRNMRVLKRAIMAVLPPKTASERLEPPELLLAIVGRRNAGKSSVVNCLAQDRRVIVSEMPGTTRDSVDVRFTFEGKSFVAIDTAGLRKKQSFENSVDFFSQSRSLRAVRRASVVVLLIDAREPITKLEKELVDLALSECKPIIIGINKWDLVKGHTTDEFKKYLHKKLGEIDFAPMVFMSAKTGLNVSELAGIAQELHEQSGIRIGTGELNRLVTAAYERHHPQPRKNKLGRLFYATQVSIYPPTVVVFVNETDLFPENWRRYLMRQLQKDTPYAEVPVRLRFKARERVVLERTDPRG